MGNNMTTTARIAGPHCESCGRLNPGTDDGYTGCCNEPVCSGGYLETWATGTMEPHQQTGRIRACCAAAAAQAIMTDEGTYVLHRES
jgi:hypothetical protein